ncbi:MAG: RidA family protein [Magnetococcales bacterium]|nr:RidA family protein [Magnetococcales bacterium]
MFTVVSTTAAPQAIGPYSQGVRVGEWLFLSGQIPLDPATGVLVEGGIAEQTRQVLQNLRAVLQAAGGDLAQVVKTTLFLVDLDDFAAVNEIYARFFQAPHPARATVQVAALPKGARVEIEAVACMGERGPT